MPRNECRCPDPVACYEKQTSYDESGVESCLNCPVASWITAMVLRERSMNASAGEEVPVSDQWFEANPLERIGEVFPSSQEVEFELQAA